MQRTTERQFPVERPSIIAGACRARTPFSVLLTVSRRAYTGATGVPSQGRKGQAFCYSDMRASREATTCISHGRESVGHATPHHVRVATRRKVSHGRNQTGKRWGGTGIPGWTSVRDEAGRRFLGCRSSFAVASRLWFPRPCVSIPLPEIRLPCIPLFPTSVLLNVDSAARVLPRRSRISDKDTPYHSKHGYTFRID